MSKYDLEQQLKDLCEELDDLRMERHFMLEKTSIHVPGHAKYKYDEEIKELEDKVKEIEKQLAAKL